MRLFLEDEGALDLKLPYEELATKVADAGRTSSYDE